MSTIVIAARDPIFGAVLADRLRVAGNVVKRITDLDRTVSEVSALQVDLLILDMERERERGLALLETLKDDAGTRSVPILALASSAESADRVAALRVGADEYLTKPCDLEEVVIRAGRLVRQPSAAAASVLQGDLADYPVWELMQFIQHAKKTGDLQVKGKLGIGRVRVSQGLVAQATWEKLEAKEALLAIFGLKQGAFKFVSDTESEPETTVSSLSAEQHALMTAAWIEDELGKRIGFLPPTGAPLAVYAPGAVIDVDDGKIESLPLEEVRAAIGSGEAPRTFDLIRSLPRAPQVIRLSVAILCEQGVVGFKPEESLDPYLTTAEIASSELIEDAVADFLIAAKNAGLGTSALPYSILAGAGPWPRLISLFETVPGFYRNERIFDFVGKLKKERDASLTLPCEHGKLSLHAQALVPEDRAKIEAVVSVAAGVLVWLDTLDHVDLVRAVIDRVRETGAATPGLLIVNQAEDEWARGLIDDAPNWKLSFHEPQTLLGIFGLLRP